MAVKDDATDEQIAIEVLGATCAIAIDYTITLMIQMDSLTGMPDIEEETLRLAYYKLLAAGISGEAVEMTGLTPEQVKRLDDFFAVWNASGGVMIDESKVLSN